MKRKVQKQGLRALGTVLHIVGHKLIVRGARVKVEHILNSVVMTVDNRKIGRVYDIFGPVDQPYISITIFKGVNEEELKGLANKKIFSR